MSCLLLGAKTMISRKAYSAPKRQLISSSKSYHDLWALSMDDESP